MLIPLALADDQEPPLLLLGDGRAREPDDQGDDEEGTHRARHESLLTARRSGGRHGVFFVAISAKSALKHALSDSPGFWPFLAAGGFRP